jgi:hypothetical protein
MNTSEVLTATIAIVGAIVGVIGAIVAVLMAFYSHQQWKNAQKQDEKAKFGESLRAELRETKNSQQAVFDAFIVALSESEGDRNFITLKAMISSIEERIQSLDKVFEEYKKVPWR